jgi:hypothetical protein
LSKSDLQECLFSIISVLSRTSVINLHYCAVVSACNRYKAKSGLAQGNAMGPQVRYTCAILISCGAFISNHRLFLFWLLKSEWRNNSKILSKILMNILRLGNIRNRNRRGLVFFGIKVINIPYFVFLRAFKRYFRFNVLILKKTKTVRFTFKSINQRKSTQSSLIPNLKKSYSACKSAHLYGF